MSAASLLVCLAEAGAEGAAAGAGSAVGARAEEIVVRLLYQLIVILLVTRLVVLGVRRLGQTDVAGEILAGLLLGPSLLGAFAPDLLARLFHPSTATVFVGIAQVGLVFLMFQIGMEFELRSALKANKRAVLVLSAVSVAAPFTLGYFSAPWFWHWLPETARPDLFGFRLFFGVAMSITAIPILGRIFMELGLSHTRTAALTIGAAALDDVLGWLLLGAIALIVAGKFDLAWLGSRLAGLALYVVVVFLVVRPLLKRWIRRELERHGRLRQPAVALLLGVLFVSGAVSSNLGVFAIIGGFTIGAALHDDRRFVAEWKTRVSPLVNTFFLPVFFAYTGLRTDVGSIDSWREGGILLLVLGVAFASKLGGAYVAARAVGEKHRSALTIATCMNTRALMELVALNIGYDLGVLPRSMFTKLVIMAIVSTYMATPIIRRLMRGQERPEGARPEPVGLYLALPETGAWEAIERARLGVRELVSGALGDRERGAAVSTVVAELLETALRLAPAAAPAGATPAPAVDVKVLVDATAVLVRVSGEAAGEAAAKLREDVRWISSFPDPREAFVAATRRVYEGEPVEVLGLARAASEGGCPLALVQDGGRFTLHAAVPREVNEEPEVRAKAA